VRRRKYKLGTTNLYREFVPEFIFPPPHPSMKDSPFQLQRGDSYDHPLMDLPLRNAGELDQSLRGRNAGDRP